MERKMRERGRMGGEKKKGINIRGERRRKRHYRKTE